MKQFIKDPKYTGLEKEKENERQATRYYGYYVHVQVEIKKGAFNHSFFFLGFIFVFPSFIGLTTNVHC